VSESRFRLLLVTPIVGDEFNAVAERYVREMPLPPDVTVSCASLDRGPVSIETMFDEAHAAPAAIEEVLRLFRSDYDAVIVNCCADPGVHALREVLDVPVVGAGEASYYTAALLAPSFSVISVLRNSVPHTRMRIRTLGLESRLASVYGIDAGVLDLKGAGIKDAILTAAVRAVEEDGADCIVLGCTGMADVAGEVRKGLRVPVVEPTAAAIWQAMSLARQGLRHGRAWMYLPADPSKLSRRP